MGANQKLNSPKISHDDDGAVLLSPNKLSDDLKWLLWNLKKKKKKKKRIFY